MSAQAEKPERAPEHVAVIMDGNGRWAEKHGLPRVEGHRRGVEVVREIVRASGDLGLQNLTLYAFSVENWRRPKEEVDFLMRLLERFLKSQRKELMERRLRLKILGDPSALPEKVSSLALKTVEETRAHEAGTLAIALNYGARQELAQAVKKCCAEVAAGELSLESIDYETIAQRFYTSGMPDPDLIIRTSGEARLSNFLLMQSAYSEFYFTQTLWPDFSAEEFKKAIQSYSARERRFGKTGGQIRAEADNALPST